MINPYPEKGGYGGYGKREKERVSRDWFRHSDETEWAWDSVIGPPVPFFEIRSVSFRSRLSVYSGSGSTCLSVRPLCTSRPIGTSVPVTVLLRLCLCLCDVSVPFKAPGVHCLSVSLRLSPCLGCESWSHVWRVSRVPILTCISPMCSASVFVSLGLSPA